MLVTFRDQRDKEKHYLAEMLRIRQRNTRLEGMQPY